MGMIWVPIIFFVVVLFAGGGELGLKGILISLLLVGTGVAISLATGNPAPCLIITVLVDVVLCLMVFGGDLRMP